MTKRIIKFIQENVHQEKASSVIFSKTFIKSKLNVALLQESWIKTHIKLQTTECKLIYDDMQLQIYLTVMLNSNQFQHSSEDILLLFL